MLENIFNLLQHPNDALLIRLSNLPLITAIAVWFEVNCDRSLMGGDRKKNKTPCPQMDRVF
jgi:hypothetical protein